MAIGIPLSDLKPGDQVFLQTGMVAKVTAVTEHRIQTNQLLFSRKTGRVVDDLGKEHGDWGMIKGIVVPAIAG